MDDARAKTMFKEQIDNLEVEETQGRLWVAPADPVKLLSHILTTGLLFMKLVGRKEVEGPFSPQPPSLSYLAHNTSDTRNFNDPIDDKYSWILASAAVVLGRNAVVPAAWCVDAHAKLKALRGSNKLPSGLPRIASRSKVGSPVHAAVADLLKQALSSAEWDQLAEFVLRAEKTIWPGFPDNRANLARYTRIVAWYRAVTA